MSQQKLLLWDIYEIETESTKIHGVKLRGRIRKLGLHHNLTVICENATDKENCVRFALLSGQEPKPLVEYLNRIIPDHTTKLVINEIPNPVLSKLKVNLEERYTI